MTPRHQKLLRAFLPLLAFSAGCISIQPPAGFVLLEDSAGEAKLVSTDDARIWVRDFSVKKQHGDLAFWSQTLRNELVAYRGHVFVEERKVEDGDGQDGVELLFDVNAQGEAHRYLVALFLYEGLFSNTVRVIEFGAPRAVFDKHLEAVRGAVKTMG
jgi:hypothetical protein